MPKQTHRHRDRISIEDRHRAKGRREGKRWLVKVRDTRRKAYVRKAFAELKDGEAWARTMLARLELGQASSGRWPLADVWESYQAQLAIDGAGEGYLRQMRQAVGMMAQVGITDLGASGLAAKVNAYLSLPTDTKHRRVDRSQAAPATVAMRYTRLRVLVKHATKVLGLTPDPLAGFKLPKQARKKELDKTTQEVFTLEEIRAILRLDLRGDPVWLAFLVAICTGLRAAEIHALRWSDVAWSDLTIRVGCGKGGKQRNVSARWVEGFLPLLSSIGGPEAPSPRIGPVVTVNRPRLNVQEHLRPLLDLAGVPWDRGVNETSGLPRRLGWHSCRRTLAAAALAAGVDSLDLQRGLGHEDLDLTGKYASSYTQWQGSAERESWPRGKVYFLAPPATAAARGAR